MFFKTQPYMNFILNHTTKTCTFMEKFSSMFINMFLIQLIYLSVYLPIYSLIYLFINLLLFTNYLIIFIIYLFFIFSAICCLLSAVRIRCPFLHFTESCKPLLIILQVKFSTDCSLSDCIVVRAVCPHI